MVVLKSLQHSRKQDTRPKLYSILARWRTNWILITTLITEENNWELYLRNNQLFQWPAENICQYIWANDAMITPMGSWQTRLLYEWKQFCKNSTLIIKWSSLSFVDRQEALNNLAVCAQLHSGLFPVSFQNVFL